MGKVWGAYSLNVCYFLNIVSYSVDDVECTTVKAKISCTLSKPVCWNIMELDNILSLVPTERVTHSKRRLQELQWV